MESIGEARTRAHMTAAERRADTISKIREMQHRGWTNGQIAAWMHLNESSVKGLLEAKA